MENTNSSSAILLNPTQIGTIEDAVLGRISLFVNAFDGKKNKSYCAKILEALVDIKGNPNINDKVNQWVKYRDKNVAALKGNTEILEALDNVADWVLKNEENRFAKQMSEKKHHGYPEEDMEQIVRDYLSNFAANQVRDALKAMKEDLRAIELKELLVKLEEKESNIKGMLEEITNKEENIRGMCLQLLELNLKEVPSNNPMPKSGEKQIINNPNLSK